MSVAVPLFTFAASLTHKRDHCVVDTSGTEGPVTSTAASFDQADVVRLGELRCDRTRTDGSGLPGRVKAQRMTISNADAQSGTGGLTFNSGGDGEGYAALYVAGGGADVVGGLRVNGNEVVTGNGTISGNLAVTGTVIGSNTLSNTRNINITGSGGAAISNDGYFDIDFNSGWSFCGYGPILLSIAANDGSGAIPYVGRSGWAGFVYRNPGGVIVGTPFNIAGCTLAAQGQTSVRFTNTCGASQSNYFASATCFTTFS